jgi:hypothetical protein
MAEISLDNLSVYNAKASLVISQVVADGDTGKANMMSSLKTTANDTTLSDAIRLNALTALINLGSLLDIPLPPYFPIVTTYANTQTYVGIHNDLSGIQGGVPGEYYHLTLAERTLALNAATQADISWTNLSGSYSQNAVFAPLFDAKQNALTGPGFVKANGGVITYDNSTYLTTISGIAAGGELSGTFPNPALSNAAVISKLLTGFTGVALPTPITSSDTILSAMQKLNNNISSLIVSPSGVASVALTTNAGTVFTTTTSPQTGAATLDISLNSQSANRFLAAPSGSSGVPSFRAFVAADLPNSGATAGTYGSSSFIPQIVVDAKGRITSISSVSAAAGGQVNTVTLTQPGIFGAVTNIGTASNVNLNYGLSTQIANYVWAGPISGANATPTFRALVATDIPSIAISQVTSLQDTLNGFLTNSLSDGSIWIGNTSNAAVQRVLSGDVTVSNTGVTAIGLAKVQYDMIQDVTSQTLLGRYDALDGEVQQVTLSGDFLLNSSTGVLSLSSPVSPVVSTKGDLLGHDLTAQQRVPSSNVDGDILLVNNSATGTYTDLGLNWVTMSGDATIVASGAITIAAGAVTLAKMANLANNRIIGNVSGGSAAPSALTGTQVTGMLDLFSSSVQGVVPASGGGTVNFLRADGSWQPPPGGGGGTTTFPLTINNSGSGASSGATFNGSAGVTISYNTIGAQASSASLTSLAALSYASTAFVKMTGANTFSLDTTTYLSGTVSLANGGTNANNTAINGGVAYSTASAINITAAGTVGQILKSNGAGAPTWTTATYPATTTQYKILVSTSNNVIGEIDAPTVNDTFLKWNAGTFSWAAAGSGSGTINAANQFSVPYYSTAGSATVLSGVAPDTGTNGRKFLSQVITAGVAAIPVWVTSTGTGSVALDTSPQFTTPDIGDATADSINNVAITATASTSTLTIGSGKTATISNTLTFTGTDTSSVAFGAGGTVAYVGLANSWTSGIKQTFAPSSTTAGINVGTLAGQPSSPANGDLVYNSSATALQAYINGAWVSLGAGGGSGTVNSGTQYQLTYYATTGTAVSGLTTGTNGQVLALSAGLVPTWTTLGTSTTLTNLGAATASNTALANAANSLIRWNWDSSTGTNAFVLGSTSLTTASLFTLTHTTSALTGSLASFTSSSVSSGTLLNLGITGTGASAKNLVITNASSGNTSGRGIDVLISGTTAAATTYGAYISNTKITGTAAYALYLNTSATATTNYGLQINASGGTTNYAIDVVAGISRFGVGTASIPQIILTPSTAAGGTTFTGTVNGSLWYDTNSTITNSSLTLYKDSAYTKILTKDRNPDFITGAQGVVVADASGNFTKSADLTALGIFAAYNTTTLPNTTTTATTMVSGSLVGSKTLPANFFALGKTIVFKASGFITLDNSRTFTFRTSLGATLNIDVVLEHSGTITSGYWDYTCSVTCKAISGTNSTYIYAAQVVCVHNNTTGANVIFGAAADSGSIAVNTGATIAVDILGNFDGTTAGDTFTAYQATSQYLN